MKIIAPAYYKKFKCIAEKCRHNCCIGWEIDIDESTLKSYTSLKGKFSRKLKSGIAYNDNCAFFRLDGKGRCAFLNENNLCDIILNLGEDSLCQICSDHPRFRNYFSDRTELGLGLCCEEAARIILCDTNNFSLDTLSDDNNKEYISEEETEITDFRNRIFEIIKNKSIRTDAIAEALSSYCDTRYIKKSAKLWGEFLLTLERLDDYWEVILNELIITDISGITVPESFDYIFRNFLTYLIYRHINEDFIKEDILFILSSYNILEYLCKMHIAKNESVTERDIIEYARIFSSEEEYSSENKYEIINFAKSI